PVSCWSLPRGSSCRATALSNETFSQRVAESAPCESEAQMGRLQVRQNALSLAHRAPPRVLRTLTLSWGGRMGFEIERKFLVCGDGWMKLASDRTGIRQGYLTSDGKASIRVRIKADGGATLTVKSRGAELRRLELEYKVPTLEAEAMLALRTGAVVEKVRHLVPWKGLTWEIDVFEGDNDGLIIAEVELLDEHQPVDLPD